MQRITPDRANCLLWSSGDLRRRLIYVCECECKCVCMGKDRGLADAIGGSMTCERGRSVLEMDVASSRQATGTSTRDINMARELATWREKKNGPRGRKFVNRFPKHTRVSRSSNTTNGGQSTSPATRHHHDTIINQAQCVS